MKKYNHRLAFFLCILLVMACFSSCKEPFDPEVELTEPLIVVDGLITTQAKPHLVKIHYAMNYNAMDVPEPVVGAIVFLKTQDGSHVPLQEHRAGHYYTNPGFKAQVGEVYVLQINTRDGLQLRSRPQEALPVAAIDSLYGVAATRSVMEINTYGDHYFYNYQGGESFINISHGQGQQVKMRYVPQILLMYSYETRNPVFPDGPPVWMNCWRKFAPSGLPSVTHLGQQTQEGGLKNHLLLFVPENRKFYRLKENEVVAGKHLIIGQYRLNDDSHAFHKALVKQLGADGNLFDPIASQLPGNMYCFNDPSQKILGFFEVSSFKSETYRYQAIPEHDRFIYSPFEDLDHIPSSGELCDEKPFFW